MSKRNFIQRPDGDKEGNVISLKKHSGDRLEEKKSLMRKEISEHWDEIVFKVSKDLKNSKRNLFFIHVLSELLEANELREIKSGLEPEQIAALNEDLGEKGDSPLNLKILERFSLELKKVYIEGGPVIDSRAAMALAGLSSSELETFLSSHGQHSSLVLGLTSAQKLAELMDSMDSDKVQELLASAEKEKPNSEEFEKDIKSFKQKKVPPFQRALAMAARNLPIEKEQALFEGFIQRKDIEGARALAKGSLPSFLLINFSSELIKAALQEVSAQEHAEFLFCLKGDEREKWMSLLSMKGSKLQEMLELELASIEGSGQAQKRIEGQSSSILKSYYKKIKSHLDKEEHSDARECVIEEWLSKNAA